MIPVTNNFSFWQYRHVVTAALLAATLMLSTAVLADFPFDIGDGFSLSDGFGDLGDVGDVFSRNGFHRLYPWRRRSKFLHRMWGFPQHRGLPHPSWHTHHNHFPPWWRQWRPNFPKNPFFWHDSYWLQQEVCGWQYGRISPVILWISLRSLYMINNTIWTVVTAIGRNQSFI
jgi:hypothetical protein